MSASALSSLTERQCEIALLAAEGLSNKEIARRLGLSENTVKYQLHRIYHQIGIRKRTALAGLVYMSRRG
jgi:RNA polymerase sigma factor (sigma-70 family)